MQEKFENGSFIWYGICINILDTMADILDFRYLTTINFFNCILCFQDVQISTKLVVTILCSVILGVWRANYPKGCKHQAYEHPFFLGCLDKVSQLAC